MALQRSTSCGMFPLCISAWPPECYSILFIHGSLYRHNLTSTMRPTSLRPAAHLLLCGLLTQKVLPFTLVRLPLQIALFVSIFVLSSLLVVWPFTLFVYQPYFSPLRPIPSAPKELNHWKTWLAAEPTPPQLLQWANVVKKDPQFRGLMRYRGIGGGERILLCNPAALKEVLVAQQYSHFDRPIMGRKRIAVQAGTGLIASGGDAHKVRYRLHDIQMSVVLTLRCSGSETNATPGLWFSCCQGSLSSILV